MKIKQVLFSLSIIMLLIVGCSSPDEDIEMQDSQKDEIVQTDLSKILSYLTDINTSNNDGFKKGGNNKGAYSAPMFSANGLGFIDTVVWRVPGDDPYTMILHYPQDGDDRTIVLNDEVMMVNFNIHNPLVILWNYETQKIDYSNACEENRKGLYHERLKVKYIPFDFDNDGIIDAYGWAEYPNDGLLKIKASLTDAQRNEELIDGYVGYIPEGCSTPTTRIDFEMGLNGKSQKVTANIKEVPL